MVPVATVISHNYRGQLVVIGQVDTYEDPDIVTEHPFIAVAHRTSRMTSIYPVMINGAATVDEAVAKVRKEYEDYGLDVKPPLPLVA